MPVCVNFNVCDNSPECSGIAACKTGAIYWDEDKESVLGGKGTLSTDNSKCVSCGQCIGEDGCPIGAIIFAETAEELREKTQNLNIDVNQVRELFVERYGAEAIDEKICIESDFLQEILGSEEGIVVIEEFTDDSIQCLLKSIPVESILDIVRKHTGVEKISYHKIYIEDPGNKEYPALALYKDQVCMGTVSGYFETEQADMLETKIQELLGGK